jgi:hypothetical protein
VIVELRVAGVDVVVEVLARIASLTRGRDALGAGAFEVAVREIGAREERLDVLPETVVPVARGVGLHLERTVEEHVADGRDGEMRSGATRVLELQRTGGGGSRERIDGGAGSLLVLFVTDRRVRAAADGRHGERREGRDGEKSEFHDAPT